VCSTLRNDTANLDAGMTEEHGVYIYSGSGSSDTDSGDHVMFMPAFNTSDEEIDLMIEKLVKLIEAFFDHYDRKNAPKL
jgi:adenosylmethionine-8-amino-7-oxononanoate aminotransferase